MSVASVSVSTSAGAIGSGQAGPVAGQSGPGAEPAGRPTEGHGRADDTTPGSARGAGTKAHGRPAREATTEGLPQGAAQAREAARQAGRRFARCLGGDGGDDEAAAGGRTLGSPPGPSSVGDGRPASPTTGPRPVPAIEHVERLLVARGDGGGEVRLTLGGALSGTQIHMAARAGVVEVTALTAQAGIRQTLDVAVAELQRRLDRRGVRVRIVPASAAARPSQRPMADRR